MRVTVPIYVRQSRPPDAPSPRFHVRPLFHKNPARGGSILSRTLQKISSDLRQMVDVLSSTAAQAELADWTFNPVLERQTVDQIIILRRRTVRAMALAVAFRSGKTRIGFFPELSLWFDVPPAKRLASRAVEVLTECLLKLEKEDPKFDADELFGEGTTHLMLTSVDVWTDVNPKLPKEPSLPMFLLGAAEPADGVQELHRVGRLLDALYPQDLDEAVFRDAEADDLLRRLTDTQRRPVVLLGARGVGKTAVIHAAVRRRLDRTEGDARAHNQVWLISPQRLISGMSYVGQWEDRLLAILKFAAKKEHILYFDDMLGLYLAGQHARSTLSVADVIRPILERREFRMLAEMTPEAYRVLRERDRAMADLLEVMPVREPTAEQARRILVTVQRRLEDCHRCGFALDALPTVIDLQRRYVRDVVMPGKAADLLTRLAGGNAQKPINRRLALEAFGAYSGLSTDFLDTGARLRRSEIVEALTHRVVGQPAAIDAMADAICVAKARLTDTSRAVATFLFLGPTGVGKTECAKALAGYLFGNNGAAAKAAGTARVPSAEGRGGAAPADGDDIRSVRAGSASSAINAPSAPAALSEDRLLRFDMNEYVDPGAAGRLIGTFRDPEGLLTSAVRRSPFGVVLLDEIEKAHPAVFDLLLAVIGEGRLTDARGRTVDFTNTIIVMTSNLGVREAGTSFGLRSRNDDDSSAHATYHDAAQRFFRPEFFNRIDRVVPFNRLDRDDIASIAQRLMQGLLRRDGLTGRRCMLRVDPVALQRIVDAGYHPQLGARALKREVEKRIATPVAVKLAAMPPGEPTIIDVLPGAAPVRDGASLSVRVTQIRPAYPLSPTRPQLTSDAWDDANDRTQMLDDLLDQMEATLAEIEERVEALAPAGELTQGDLSPRHFVYLALREQLKVVAAAIGRLDRAVEASTRPPQRNVRKGGRPPQHQGRLPLTRHPAIADAWALLLAGHGLPDPPPPERIDDHHDRLQETASELLDEMALLAAMTTVLTADAEDKTIEQAAETETRMLLVLRCQSSPDPLAALAAWYIAAFARQLGVLVEDVTRHQVPAVSREMTPLPATARALVIDLPSARSVLAGEVGTHLFVTAGESPMTPVDVQLHALPPGAEPHQYAQRLAAHPPPATDQPPRVIRAYTATATLDLRTGLATEKPFDGTALRRMILASLPVGGVERTE